MNTVKLWLEPALNKTINSSQILFGTKVAIQLQFDHVLVLKQDQKLFWKIMEQHGSADVSLDHHNDLYPHLKKILKYLLRKRFWGIAFQPWFHLSIVVTWRWASN
jgi:hypothetical protein